MRFEIIGSMRLFVLDKKTNMPLPKRVTKHGIYGDTGWIKNMIVETGKEFILDEIFNQSKWNAGLGIRAVSVGRSTDTNAGVQGPDAVTQVPLGGAWNGVAEDDWRLSDEMARSIIISATRTDQTMTAVAQFVDAQFISEPDPIKIREVGIFLHTTTPPSANPQDIPAQKEFAMVARRVYYGYDDEITPQYFVDRPFLKVKDGNPLLMEYRIELG